MELKALTRRPGMPEIHVSISRNSTRGFVADPVCFLEFAGF